MVLSTKILYLLKRSVNNHCKVSWKVVLCQQINVRKEKKSPFEGISSLSDNLKMLANVEVSPETERDKGCEKGDFVKDVPDRLHKIQR